MRIAALALPVLALVLALSLGAALLTPFGRSALDRARAETRLLLDLRALGARRADTLMLAMADGVRLATDVYLPRDRAERLPAILIRLPYGKRRYFEVRRWLALFLPRGYAVVVQDMRGRFGSGGVFAPWPNAAPDGAATLDWIVARDWSDGQVGTIGCSALGESQVILATARHPAHRAMIPIGAGGAIGSARGLHGYFGMFQGGISTLASDFGWFTQHGGKTPGAMGGVPVDFAQGLATLPHRDMVARYRSDPTDYEALLDGFATPGALDAWGYVTDADRFATPALLVDGWFDSGLPGTLALAGLMRDSGLAPRVLIGPGTHCDIDGGFRDGAVGDVAVDPAGARDLDDLFGRVMDAHLKSAPAPDLAPYTVWVMREDRWLSADRWPPAGTAALWLTLDGDRLHLPAQPPGAGGARSFVSDPMNPVPTLGGAICCTGDPALRIGPLDQRPIEGRDDLLIYTSAPLEAPLRLTGPVTARLRVVADVPDTDLVLRLTDVAPDGRSLTITESGLRLRYRDGVEAPRLLTPGRAEDITLHLPDIAWQVPPGHRLRLHVAGSSFPRLARNMNGGGDPHRESTPHPARITILSDAAGRSTLRLAVLP